jgi:hypothetical protein
VNWDRKNKPTTAKPQFVAFEKTRSRVIRRFLAMLVRFVRRKPPLPRLEGHLSLWICELHGLGLTCRTAGQDSSMGSLSLTAIQAITPDTNPKSVRQKTADSLAIASDPDVTRLIKTVKQGDLTEVNKDFEKTLQKIIDIWFPGFRLPLELSVANVLKLIRASRALFICTALQGTHPLILIARAWRGERKAVLDLVKVDKLFLQDPCTQSVIKQAALQHDQEFLVQLAKAQKYQPALRSRDLFHLYFYVLFFCEELGQSLPRIDELQRLLDPRGTKFEGPYAFERDLQRRRVQFREMLTNGESELPSLRGFYGSAPPSTI